MDLMKASTQWATRPADERFWTLSELITAADGFRSSAGESTVRPCDLEVVAAKDSPNGLVLHKRGSDSDAFFSHYAFAQACRLSGDAEMDGSIPSAAFLRTLPATMAGSVLTHCLSRRKDDLKLLWDRRDSTLRCMTSNRYGRIWNADIAKKIEPLQGIGWKN